MISICFKEFGEYISSVVYRVILEKLSNEMIAYYTLPGVVVVLGICVCLILYKYKIVGKMKKVPIIHPQNPSLPQHRQQIETEERLYDIIGETHMLRYVQQMMKSTGSIIGDSKSVGSHETSLDEGQKKTIEQFIDHPVVKLSPSQVRDYDTVAIVHTVDSSL